MIAAGHSVEIIVGDVATGIGRVRTVTVQTVSGRDAVVMLEGKPVPMRVDELVQKATAARWSHVRDAHVAARRGQA